MYLGTIGRIHGVQYIVDLAAAIGLLHRKYSSWSSATALNGIGDNAGRTVKGLGSEICV